MNCEAAITIKLCVDIKSMAVLMKIIKLLVFARCCVKKSFGEQKPWQTVVSIHVLKRTPITSDVKGND